MNTTEKTAITWGEINDDLLNLVFRKGLAFSMEDFNSGFGKFFKDIKSLRESKENCTEKDFDLRVKENQIKIEEVWCSTLNSILEEYDLEVKVLGPDYMREKVFMASIDLLEFILRLPKISQLMSLIELHQTMSRGEGSIPPKVIKMTLLLSIYLIHVGFVNTCHVENLFDTEGNDQEGKEERVKEFTKGLVEVLFRIPMFLAERLCAHFQRPIK
jgi:hypothetical protein